MKQNKLWRRGITMLTVALATAGLASCSSEELAGEPLPEGKYPLELTASVDKPQTRAAGKDAFSDGDAIGVRIGTSGAGSKYVINGSMQAQPANDSETIYWQSKDPQTVEAWYPYDAQNNIDISDQADGYTQFDYLKATATDQSYASPVTLSFKHQMAKVKCTLIKVDGVTDEEINSAVVSVAGYTTASFDKGTVTGNTDGWITTTTADHEALLVPHDISAGTSFIKVTINGNDFIYTHAATQTFVAGKTYTYNITVKKDKLELSDCTITDWNTSDIESGNSNTPIIAYDVDPDGAYHVYNYYGLMVWANDPDVLNKSCTLEADITLPEVPEGESNWTAIGNISSYYKAIFDGNGHTIYNLTINKSGSNYQGFIGGLYSSGTVSNLTLSNAKIVGKESVGGFVGFSYNGKVDNCHLVGGSTVKGKLKVNGVVGYNQYGRMTNCDVSEDCKIITE